MAAIFSDGSTVMFASDSPDKLEKKLADHCRICIDDWNNQLSDDTIFTSSEGTDKEVIKNYLDLFDYQSIECDSDEVPVWFDFFIMDNKNEKNI